MTDRIERFCAGMKLGVTDVELDGLKREGVPYEGIVAYLAHLGGELFPIEYRPWLVDNFAWAIPNDAAIQAIVDRGDCVEIGAGRGYWAYRVSQAGGTLTAYDAGHYKNTNGPGVWTDVLSLSACDVVLPADSTLFICWPDFEACWPLETLNRWEGETLIYVGEGLGGCCATDAFHEHLDAQWCLEEEIDIPTFFGIHDVFQTWSRGSGP